MKMRTVAGRPRVSNATVARVVIVTIDRHKAEATCSAVAAHFEGGFSQASGYLTSLGQERIGFIGAMKCRHTSHKRAVKMAGVVYRPELIREGDYRVKRTGERSLRQQSSLAIAVMIANDLAAHGVVHGLRILCPFAPKNLSVVGLDDELLTVVIQPSLTTLRFPRKRLAKPCLDGLAHTKEDVKNIGKQFRFRLS